LKDSIIYGAFRVLWCELNPYCLCMNLHLGKQDGCQVWLKVVLTKVMSVV
jgi:hypothetical protein